MARQGTCPSPLAALGLGLLAGALGAAGQNLFFRASAKIAPETPKNAFSPPEPEQANELATQTIARRFVQHLMQRGTLAQQVKPKAGKLVHYAFGSAWGGLYGLAAESIPALSTLPAALGFGVVVWMASDNGLLPVFKLAAPMTAYPVRVHAYGVAAHFVYGASVWAAYRGLRASPWAAVALIGASRVFGPRRGVKRRVRRAVSGVSHAVSEMRL